MLVNLNVHLMGHQCWHTLCQHMQQIGTKQHHKCADAGLTWLYNQNQDPTLFMNPLPALASAPASALLQQ
jgi:hypothetical protein